MQELNAAKMPTTLGDAKRMFTSYGNPVAALLTSSGLMREGVQARRAIRMR